MSDTPHDLQHTSHVDSNICMYKHFFVFEGRNVQPIFSPGFPLTDVIPLAGAKLVSLKDPC